MGSLGFLSLRMGLQFYMNGFIWFSKKYPWIPDIKFMTSSCQTHEFTYFFMKFIRTTMNIFIGMVMTIIHQTAFLRNWTGHSFVVSVSHLGNFGNNPFPKPKKNITSIFFCPDYGLIPRREIRSISPGVQLILFPFIVIVNL